MAKTSNRWFKSVKATDLLKALPASRVIAFKAGAQILKEGEKADSCFLIVKGKVEIRKRLKDKTEATVATLGKNEFFGEMAMLSGNRRSASSVASNAVEVIEIKATDFGALAKKGNPLAAQLSMQFAVQLSLRSSNLLKLFANKVGRPGRDTKKPVDVREVLHKIYSVWAI